MEFTEISEKEYQAFWENHPQKTFLSAIEIGKLRRRSQWQVYYVAIKQKNEILAAAMLLSHKRHFNKYEFYSPRGPLLEYKDEQMVKFFIQEIRKFIKKKNGYILRIDPYLIYKERDIDGTLVPSGEDNSKVVKTLEKIGFKKIPINEMEQVGWMFSLDLDGKTEDQILKEMKPNTRNIIRKTEKFGITMHELTYEELNKFQNIMEETGKRKDFSIRKLDYFQTMYQLFHDKKEVKYYITELNLKEYIARLQEEKMEKEEKIKKLSEAKYNEGQKKNITNEITSIEKRIEEAQRIRKDAKQDIITLSGSMFILIQPEIIYLSSGNYEEYMKFNSQYLIQWELIKYGIKHGFKKHNFYGIPANINEHPKDYGIYEFKRGFNGYVEELIGEFELPITWHYYILKWIHKIRGEKK